MIVQNETKTIKNLQNILEMNDIVILYDANLHKIVWVGFVRDLPFIYLHRKIVNILVFDISVLAKLGTIVYFR